MSRQLIVDGQIFQTPAWHRGMGKYSLSLLKELVSQKREKTWESITVILSKQLPDDTLKELRGALQGAVFTLLDLKAGENGEESVFAHNRRVINKYIGSINNDVDFLILSLTQRESCPVFPEVHGVRKVLLTYDVIPLIFPDLYLSNEVVRSDYLSRLVELFKADIYATISKTVGNDLTTHLGIDASRIASIDGAPIVHNEGKRELSVKTPYILMPTGNDYRKNNSRGIKGFAAFNKAHDDTYTLVVTSFFDNEEKLALGALCKDIIFTGNVDGNQLDALYEGAEGLLFPAEYEGLGLPILEAVEKHKPVACSDISVFKEISTDAFHYFDPHVVRDITRSIESMIKNPTVDKVEYQRIMEEYTWENTASKLVAAVESLTIQDVQLKPVTIAAGYPVSEEGLASVLLKGYAEMCRIFESSYYFGNRDTDITATVNFLPYVAKTEDMRPGIGVSHLQQKNALYFISNNRSSSSALFMALAVPGIAIIDSTALEETWQGMTEQGYIPLERITAEQIISRTTSKNSTDLVVSLVRTQKAIVVFEDEHKTIVEKVIEKYSLRAKVYMLSFPISHAVYDELVDQAPDMHKHSSYRKFAEEISHIMETIHG